MSPTYSPHATEETSESEPAIHVEQLGDGEPKLAIVGAIHGDEPCGARAIKTLLAESSPLDRPVKFIIANERALNRGVRYIETDLNRVFPGDPASELYETRLAPVLLDELQDCTVLSMHSTQSTDQPFAIVDEMGPLAETICPHLSVTALVEASPCVTTALGAFLDAIEVECGRQGSAQATANATQLVREFLTASEAMPGTSELSTHPLPIFQLQHRIPKPPANSYAVHATNFEQVPVGTPYATVDGDELTADESFYPVLMSPDGYESQFGYAAELTGTLGEKRP